MLSICTRDTRRFEGKCRPHLQGLKAHEGDTFLGSDANHLPTDAASLLRSPVWKNNSVVGYFQKQYLRNTSHVSIRLDHEVLIASGSKPAPYPV